MYVFFSDPMEAPSFYGKDQGSHSDDPDDVAAENDSGDNADLSSETQ